MWKILSFKETDGSLIDEIWLPAIDDDTVRQIIHQEDDPHIRFYVYDVPGKNGFDKLVAYAEQAAKFDKDVVYQVSFWP